MDDKKKPVTIIIAVLVVIFLGAGGYFAFVKLQQQTDINSENLASAGDVLVGDTFSNFGTASEDNPGVESPTFDTNTTPSRRIVNSLQTENVKLNTEILRLQDQITDLNQHIDELEDYKQVNERFAPKRMKDELADVENQIKAFLLESEDAERFSVSQIEIMSAASALEYKEFVTRNRLMIRQEQRSRLTLEFLPGYAFCVGDGIALAANNSAELDLIAKKFRGVPDLNLPKNLAQDLETVLTPCQKSLRMQLDSDLADNPEETI